MTRPTHLTLIKTESDAAPRDAEVRDSSPYFIHLVVFGNGERFPLLFSRSTGVPVPEAALYAVKFLRPKSIAYRSLEKHLLAIQFLLCFGWAEGIDVLGRVRTGEFLSAPELDRLSSAASHPLSNLRRQTPLSPGRQVRTRSRERARAAARQVVGRVAPETAAVRLSFCRKFLERIALNREAELVGRTSQREGYAGNRAAFLRQLKARIAGFSFSRQAREAPSPQVIRKILDAAHPTSPSNPWKNARTRIRNYILIRWLVETGLRIGELLNLRVSDIVSSRQEVRIVRRPDSRDDPRRRQPTVKRHGRLLDLMALGAETKRYILETRREIPNATTHPFLFVATRGGRPLTVGAAEKAVSQLGKRIGFEGSLSPHLLRHAWNEALSKQMDADGVDEETEQIIRATSMGWDDDSETARIYTRRHTRELAAQVLKRMNERLLRGRSFRPW
jgi:integrase